jgi:YgiT-type zinc finger domain-containing protein
MKCVICKHGETKAGHVVLTLVRDGSTFVIRNVPADVCQNCGEEYVEGRVTDELLKLAGREADAGVQVDIRDYLAA